MQRSIEWAAGLFDGEGYITKTKDKRCNSYAYRIGIEMSDKDLIDDFYNFWGFGRRYERDRANRKHTWIWHVGDRDLVRYVLGKMLPHFGQRRAYKALNILDDLECT